MFIQSQRAFGLAREDPGKRPAVNWPETAAGGASRKAEAKEFGTPQQFLKHEVKQYASGETERVLEEYGQQRKAKERFPWEAKLWSESSER